MLTRNLLDLRSTLTELCLWILLLVFVGGGYFIGAVNTGNGLGALAYGTVGTLAFLIVGVLFISPFLILGEILETVKRIEAK